MRTARAALVRIAAWAVEHPGPVLAATVLAALVAAIGALGLDPETGTESLVDRDSRAYEATEERKRDFGDDPVVVLVRGDLEQLVLTEDVTTLLMLEGCLAGNLPAEEDPAAQAAAAGVVQPGVSGPAPEPCARLAELDPAAVVYGPATFLDQSARRIQELLGAEAQSAYRQARRAYLRAARGARAQGLGSEDQQRAGRAAAQEVLVAFEQRVADLAVSAGLTGLPRLEDPRFVSSVVFADRGEGEPRARFAYLFPSPTSVLISVRLRPDLSDGERREAIELIRAATAEPAFRIEDAEYVVSGVPVVAEGLADAISHEALVLLLVALAVMAAVLALVLGPPLRLLPLAIALVAAALTFGFLAAAGGTLTMASVAVLPVLIGLAVDYAIQLQARFVESVRAGLRPPRAALEAAARGAPVIGTAALAAAAALAALGLSPIPQVRGFGVLLVAGVALAFALALTAGLAALSLVGPRPRSGEGRSAGAGRLGALAPAAVAAPVANAAARIGAARARIGERVRALGRRLLGASLAAPAATLLIAAALAVCGWVAGTRTEVISDLRELVPRELPALRDVDELQEETGVSGEVDIAVSAPDITEPAVVAWMGDVRERVLDRVGFEAAESSCVEQDTPLCPSISLPDLFGGDDAEPGRRRIRRILELLPPYFSQAVVSRATEGEDDDRAVIAFAIKVMPFDEQKELIDAIRDEVGAAGGPPDGVRAEVVGLPVLAADANAALQGNHYLLALAGLAAVAAVLLAVYRSPRRALVPLVPIAFATGWTALVLWLVGVPLNPMSATLGALVIAITTEFSVILSARYEEERARGGSLGEALRTAYARTGTAVAASGITGIAGFAALIASDIRMLRDFGLVTVIDLAVVLAGVLIVLPATLALAERVFGPGRQA
ncbi:MAG TPA: MMPL family transporter [Solirubrobacterales bacterium]|nr:MMPL family transporter [Solirubrobacterales bacterium]